MSEGISPHMVEAAEIEVFEDAAKAASYALEGDPCQCGCGDLLYVTCSGCDKDMTMRCYDGHDCPAEADDEQAK